MAGHETMVVLGGDALFTVEGTHFGYQPHWNHSIIYLNSACSPHHIKIELCLPGSIPGVANFLPPCLGIAENYILGASFTEGIRDRVQGC